MGERLNDLPQSSSAIRTLAEKLVCHLKDKFKNTQQGVDDWNERNKHVLDEFFCCRDCQCNFTRSKAGREFLWDFTAYIPSKGMLLVGESERDPHYERIVEDFDKLLYSNAPIRLMICRIDEQEESEAKDKAERIRAGLELNVQQNCTSYSGGEVIILYCVWWALDDKKNRDFAYLLQIDGEPNYRDAKGKGFKPVSCEPSL